MRAIQFKTKVRQITEHDGTRSQYIDFKRKLTKSDCTLKPHEHMYYNSDVFISILNRVYRRIIGEHTEWKRVQDLPSEITLDTSRFLAVVTIPLPDGDFLR